MTPDKVPRERQLELAWETGRNYQPTIEEAADDMRNAPTLAPPARSYDERVGDRLAEMARLGAPDPLPAGATRRVSSTATRTGPGPDDWAFLPDDAGALVLAEPVPWEGGPDRVPAAAKEAAERNRRHDAEVLRIGLAAKPINDWRQIHAGCTPIEWGRIWGNLHPDTHRTMPDLDPRLGGPVR